MAFLDRRTARVLLTILLFASGVAIVYVARVVIVIFAFSLLFAYLIDPVGRFLQRHSLFLKDLRGPHVVEAYLAFVVAMALLSYALAPHVRHNAVPFLNAVPSIADRVSSGQIASDLGSNFGWSDVQTTHIKTFLQARRSMIESAIEGITRFASTAIGGILVIPILAIFFLSDGENMANQAIRLLSTEKNHASLRSLAGQLHSTLQHYIRAKVTLAGLSLVYCFTAMVALRFPHALGLGILAGVLEFIPVAGWMAAAATILSAGALAHAHWVWMLALLCVWRVLMDYWIAPRVMGHELEIHPLLAIFTLMVGGAVGGIVGIYLSVPLVATLRVVYRKFASPAARNESPESSAEQLTVVSIP